MQRGSFTAVRVNGLSLPYGNRVWDSILSTYYKMEDIYGYTASNQWWLGLNKQTIVMESGNLLTPDLPNDFNVSLVYFNILYSKILDGF
jgi:hypothetical protein